MFLVMGVTGKVGGATARHLLAHGKRVRALVRSREKAADWIADFSGSIPFLLLHVLFFAVWILLNVPQIPGAPMFDPYGFGTTFSWNSFTNGPFGLSK